MKLEPLIEFYNNFAPESIARFPEFYSADAYFKDPFNEVRGIVAIQRIFTHMFSQVTAPRFVVKEQLVEAQGAMLVWDFSFEIKRWGRSEALVIRGISHLKFEASGKVCYHRDYWDPVEELYVKLPLIGALARRVQKCFST